MAEKYLEVTGPEELYTCAADRETAEAMVGYLHDHIVSLRASLAAAERERDEWKQLAETSRCPDCHAELTACGEMTADGPTLDCPVCKLRSDRDEASRQRDTALARVREALDFIGNGRVTGTSGDRLTEARQVITELRQWARAALVATKEQSDGGD